MAWLPEVTSTLMTEDGAGESRMVWGESLFPVTATWVTQHVCGSSLCCCYMGHGSVAHVWYQASSAR